MVSCCWFVTDLERSVQRQVGIQQVLRFEVTMHDAILMKILEDKHTVWSVSAPYRLQAISAGQNSLEGKLSGDEWRRCGGVWGGFGRMDWQMAFSSSSQHALLLSEHSGSIWTWTQHHGHTGAEKSLSKFFLFSVFSLKPEHSGLIICYSRNTESSRLLVLIRSPSYQTPPHLHAEASTHTLRNQRMFMCSRAAGCFCTAD